MEHCKEASFIISGNGIGWIKCDKIVGDHFPQHDIKTVELSEE
jgi:hypothetical protein